MAKAPAAGQSSDWDRDAALTTARILLEIKAINFRPEEPYTFTSGWKSPVYIDCRRIIFFPRARTRICELGVEKINRHIGFETIEAVAGGETAGIPFAAWIADRMSAPMAYVRKRAKGFGRNALIEGDVPEGKRTLLVEDLTTDGQSKIRFAQALRDAGDQRGVFGIADLAAGGEELGRRESADDRESISGWAWFWSHPSRPPRA